MSLKDQPAYPPHRPNPEIEALWPDISGNEINGLGDPDAARPRPVFWRSDDSSPHTPVMFYFRERDQDNEQIARAREYRQRTMDLPVSDIAPTPHEQSAAKWTAWIKKTALEVGADDVGICAYREEWSFDDRPVPQGKWAVVVAFKQS